MNCLLIYCHPSPESFSAALFQAVRESLAEAGHRVRVVDLYGDGFEPVMAAAEWRDYEIPEVNEKPVADQVELLRWAEMLVFVYPTWWYGLPALLKGWLDRVFLPHVSFTLPTETERIKPNLNKIRKLAVVTTCGANWWFSKLIGEPGRKTILRGIRALCHPACKTKYLALYRMDTVSPAKRRRFLAQVAEKLKRF